MECQDALSLLDIKFPVIAMVPPSSGIPTRHSMLARIQPAKANTQGSAPSM